MSDILDLSPEEIKSAIGSGSLTIGVLGLGWMGLPTAGLFIKAGAQVIGADINPQVVELLRAGKSHVDEPNLQTIIAQHIGGRFIVTADVREAAAKSDVILIIVPTSVDGLHRPDYSAVEGACREAGRGMRSGCLVVVKSTVGPGVTEGMVKRTLEASSGLRAGADFGLAYSPIRAMAGSVMKDVEAYPKIVGAIDVRSLEAAAAVFASIAKGGVVRVRDVRTAEAVKLFENIYRDVNIALATELALFCEKADLDFAEVREAAVTQPYCHLHLPRVGVGGHCIPFNPYFLVAEADSVDADMRLVKAARKINDGMPAHIVDMVAKGLKACRRGLKGAKVAVLGVSYRNDVKETNNSPSLAIIEMLAKRGAEVRAYDPFYSAAELEALGFCGAESVERAVEGADCVLVAVGHSQFKRLRVDDVARLVGKSACIVDGWRIFDAGEVRAHRLIYCGVGLG